MNNVGDIIKATREPLFRSVNISICYWLRINKDETQAKIEVSGSP